MRKETKDDLLTIAGGILLGGLAVAATASEISRMNRDIESIKSGDTYSIKRIFESIYSDLVTKGKIDNFIKEDEMRSIEFIVTNTRPREYSNFLEDKLRTLNSRYNIYY